MRYVAIINLAVGIVMSALPTGAHAKTGIALRFDYAGARAVLALLGTKNPTNAQINRVVAVRGARAMINNTIKYLPSNSLDGFASAVRQVAATRKESTGDYQLDDVWAHRAEIQELIAALQANERPMVAAIVAKLLRYAPMAKDVTITAHFVAGGVSDGFLLDNDPKLEFFVALGKGDQDLPGLKLNITHEAFHAVQKALGKNHRRMAACVDDPNAGPPPVRLICTTLLEGTATFVADPTKSRAHGPYIDMWRSRYKRNLRRNALADAFTLFDQLLANLQDRSMTWKAAYAKAFTPPNTPAYFVGYEMARTIARYDGPAAIGALFEAAPVDFFREYIRLYHSHPDLRFRFSSRTERFIESRSVKSGCPPCNLKNRL